MRRELAMAGHEVQFLAINIDSGRDYQSEFVKRCEFPLFQDESETNAWQMHGAGKDDFFVYDASGVLQVYLPAQGEVATNLSTGIGYENLKQAIVGVLNMVEPRP